LLASHLFIGDKEFEGAIIEDVKRLTLVQPMKSSVVEQGTACTVVATTLAASVVYAFSKGLGRKFAEQMIDAEMKDSASNGNAAKRALGRVQQSVEKGNFWQQYSAVLALRLTPVIPFR
jgi:hypothetical protein